MKRLTIEWVTKAEGDFHTAQRELRARVMPNHDSSCFHSQQCIEKYLKARLQEAGTAFPHTHDLELLLKLVLPVEPLWSGLLSAMRLLHCVCRERQIPRLAGQPNPGQGGVRSLPGDS